MLNSKPIDYSEELSKVVNSSVTHFETLILNNDLSIASQSKSRVFQ